MSSISLLKSVTILVSQLRPETVKNSFHCCVHLKYKFLYKMHRGVKVYRKYSNICNKVVGKKL